jgi:hypothetical protein
VLQSELHSTSCHRFTFKSKFLLKAPPKWPTCLAWHSQIRSKLVLMINQWRPLQKKVWTPWSTHLFLHCQHNRVIVAREINLKLLQKTRAPNWAPASQFHNDARKQSVLGMQYPEPRHLGISIRTSIYAHLRRNPFSFYNTARVNSDATTPFNARVGFTTTQILTKSSATEASRWWHRQGHWRGHRRQSSRSARHGSEEANPRRLVAREGWCRAAEVV